jgi:hypothetical protein
MLRNVVLFFYARTIVQASTLLAKFVGLTTDVIKCRIIQAHCLYGKIVTGNNFLLHFYFGLMMPA